MDAQTISGLIALLLVIGFVLYRIFGQIKTDWHSEQW